MNNLFLFCLAAVLSQAVPCLAGGAAAGMQGTAPGSRLSGLVSLEETAGGLKVSAKLAGVPAGEHGFHIHEFGSCEDQGKAAGSHFNPAGAPHGHMLRDGPKKAHAGDMGNIAAGADGQAALEIVIPKAALGGKRGVAGRSVVLHEKADDFGQPTGNASGRIACGIIGITAN